MAEASEANAGKIVTRGEIRYRGFYGARRKPRGAEALLLDSDLSSYMNQPFICVHHRGKWVWQSLDDISKKGYQENKTVLINKIKTDYDITSINAAYFPIKISGVTGSNAPLINGIYYPIPDEGKEGEHIIYLRNDEIPVINKKWLYFASDDAWRVGNTKHKTLRKPIGWIRQAPSNNILLKPWEVEKSHWNVWDGSDNNGSWITSPELTFERLSSPKQDKITLLQKRLDNQYLYYKKINDLKIKYKKISSVLFNKLSRGDKQTLIQTNHDVKNVLKEDELCACCFSKKPTTPCLHFDCPGACEDCRNEDNVDNQPRADCCACGKEQKLQCPICFDVFSQEHLEIFKCRHCICIRCYLNSYLVKKHIKKCPSCRAKLPKNHILH